MNDKLVTVVIPTYKRPDMIGRAVESVKAQSYPFIEIIVVDDNGRGTEAQIETEKIMQQYPDVTYLVHEVNRNGSAARNTGWRASKGEYITFLDDDDEISTTKIEKQVACLEKLDETWGACYTSYHILMENGTVQYSGTRKSGNVYLQALARNLYMGSGSNVFLRKSAVDKVEGYDESFKRNQDIEFMTRVFEQYKLAFVDEDLLTIHMEVRAIKRTFEFTDNISKYYIERFSDKINALSKKDKKKVISIISLDRARTAWNGGEKDAMIKILKENHVSLWAVFCYFIYLAKRVITKKSYGFFY